MTIPRNIPVATVDCPLIQFANGRTTARFTEHAKWTSLTGFHSEVGKAPEFDDAVAAAGAVPIEIKHQRPGGSAIVHHWYFGEQLRVYPVTAGPPAVTISGLLHAGAATAQAGLGVRWVSGERSRLALRGYIAIYNGITLSWSAPLPLLTQLVVKSRMTDRLLLALLDHYRVIAAADNLIDRKKHPELVSYDEVALPLVTGDDEDWGAGESTTVTPLRSGHPAAIDNAYLKTRGIWRSDGLHAAAVASWDAVAAWAHGYAAGDDGDLNGAVE